MCHAAGKDTHHFHFLRFQQLALKTSLFLISQPYVRKIPDDDEFSQLDPIILDN